MYCVLLYLLTLPVHPVTIQLHTTVDGKKLQLSDKVYYNRLGEPFTVNRLRYYISRIRITGADGVETLLSDRSYLVDETVVASQTIHLNSIVENIRSIKFVIGVDSALSVSGVQEGDLDPARGMFWTWNSGYIFARLEGQSDSSHAPAHSFTWDIGGYRQSANAIREVSLDLAARRVGEGNGVNHGNVGVSAGNNGDNTTAMNGSRMSGGDQLIQIRAELLQWFDAVRPIRIAAHPVCHQPGPLAMQIADNYARMFSIE